MFRRKWDYSITILGMVSCQNARVSFITWQLCTLRRLQIYGVIMRRDSDYWGHEDSDTNCAPQASEHAGSWCGSSSTVTDYLKPMCFCCKWLKISAFLLSCLESWSFRDQMWIITFLIEHSVLSNAIHRYCSFEEFMCRRGSMGERIDRGCLQGPIFKRVPWSSANLTVWKHLR